MNEASDMLAKQAEWQVKRIRLSWPEKIRMAETVRPTVASFAAMRRRLEEDRTGEPTGELPMQSE